MGAVTEEQVIESGEKLYRKFSAIYRFDTNFEDDVRQEIFLALWRAARTYDPTLAPWEVYARIRALSAVKDFFRQKNLIGKRWKRGEGVTYLDSLDAMQEMRVEPITYDRYFGILEDLQPYTLKEKRILLLMLQGYSIPEIANILNTHITTIRRTLERLRIKSTPSSFTRLTDIQQDRRAA